LNMSAADMAKHARPGATASSDQASQLFASADANGDGALSADEFASLKPSGGHHGGHHGGAGGAPPSDQASDSSSSSSSTTYAAADTNQDGVVSPEELAASLQSALSSFGSSVNSESLKALTKLIAQVTQPASAGSSVSVAA
jgi:Ca2+-binding EF-hand superfamily protein